MSFALIVFLAVISRLLTGSWFPLAQHVDPISTPSRIYCLLLISTRRLRPSAQYIHGGAAGYRPQVHAASDLRNQSVIISVDRHLTDDLNGY